MMAPILLTFLGTGTSQGIPVIGSKHPVCLSSDPRDQRLRVSVHLQWENYSWVIDCGPDFRQQILRSQITHLDGILMTHEHNDHMAGLDDVRPFNFMQKQEIPLFGCARTLEAIKTRFPYIFVKEDKYPGAPGIRPEIISAYNPFLLGGKTVMPIQATHGSLPILGFRVDNFAYMTDVKTLDSEAKSHLKQLDVLILSALRNEPHPMHLNLPEALDLINELKPRQTYLTHISHLMGFHKEVSEALPEGVFLAYDQLKIEI
jgi:phosphoribosyl 1,2-cyclic phosphate phosphodiesterase